jgi:hypothetical protein
MLHVRMKMRSGGCVAFSQNTDTDTGVGVVRSFDPGSITRGTACLTSVCLQGDIKALIYGEARRVVGTTFFAYRDVRGGSKEPWNMWLRARRRVGDYSGMFSRR